MTAVSELVHNVRGQLLSGQREEYNQIDGAQTAADTTIEFQHDISNLQAGAVLTVGLEDIYVWSKDANNLTATVSRGWNGTTAAAMSDGDLVYINTRFPAHLIVDAINTELRDLSSPMNGLFQMSTVDISFNGSQSVYDMTSVTDVIDVWDVRYRRSGAEKAWPRVGNWKYMPSSDTADFASGNAIQILEGDPGQDVRVWYKAPFTSVSGMDDDLEADAGLPATALDIPELGAIMRLTAVRDVKRNFVESQPPPRRADEVPAGAHMETAGGLRALRRERISAERARLLALFPARSR